MDIITNLKHSQGEGMGELLLAENETVSRPSVHINAGQRVHLGVHPVQTLVDHVCSERERTTQRSRYLAGHYKCVLILQYEWKLMGSTWCIHEVLLT